MSQQARPRAPKQRQLRKLVKTLTKVSNVQTAEIRKHIQAATNPNRSKYHLQDRLLNPNPSHKPHLPHVLFTHRLFEQRGNKIASLKEKKIESEACLKRVNFQYRKLQVRKQQMAKKHHLSSELRKSPHQITVQPPDITNLRISQVFQKVEIDDEESQKQVILKVKTTLNSSRTRVKTLYTEHCQSLKALAGKRRNQSNPEIELSPDHHPLTLSQYDQSMSYADSAGNPFTQTHSIIVKPASGKRKKQSLIDLIELSRVRTKLKEQTVDQKLTHKEISEHKANLSLISSLKGEIDRENKLRESIVLGGLKKLLYGDRRGRFIQDNTFKTRLQGENSPEYLNILKQQEHILMHFDGSLVNRRNLAEKFSNILGTINRTEKNVHEGRFQH